MTQDLLLASGVCALEQGKAQEDEQAMGWALPFHPSCVSWIISSHTTETASLSGTFSRKGEGPNCQKYQCANLNEALGLDQFAGVSGKRFCKASTIAKKDRRA
jgi:hypothetical protein